MQLALDGNFKSNTIQQCRMWTCIVTLVEIATADGKRLEVWAFHRDGERQTSKLQWRNQGRPSRAAWKKWVQFLESLTMATGTQHDWALNSRYQLHKWYSTHQHWEWTGNGNVVLHTSGRQYWREGHHLRELTSTETLVETSVWPVSVTNANRQYFPEEIDPTRQSE